MANINVSLEGGLVNLTINTNDFTVEVQNTDPSQSAVFNVFNASELDGQATGSVVVWSYTQAPDSTSTIAIPATDNNGASINWQVGQVKSRFGTSTTVTSPPWQLTMA